mgnify:CR=1 FL=1
MSTAKVIDSRLQSSSEQCPGRTPDMGAEAAADVRVAFDDDCRTLAGDACAGPTAPVNRRLRVVVSETRERVTWRSSFATS